MNSYPLTDVVRSLEEKWINEYRSEAANNAPDAMIIYAELLLNGAASRTPDVNTAIQMLSKASRRSAEACYKLGRIYLKGKIIAQNIEEAFFYLKVATLFKCKCGKLAEAYHSHKISNAHPCYVNEAEQLLQLVNVSSETEDAFEVKFYRWKERTN